MYSTLITKIETLLESVAKVKLVFTTPNTKIDKFPAVFFKPDGFNNTFETQNENMATYRFLMVVIVGTNGTTIENAFGTVLPNTVDQIISAFDSGWNQGTIEGHRATIKIDSAGPWEVSEEEDGIVCYAPLNVEIRLLTSN
jgi:hypothetical protein